MNTSKMAMTAPKEGLDARVGQEMGNPMGFLMRRTKRNEELIALPEVMAMADRLAEHMERFAAIEEVEVKDLDVTVLPTQTKRYISIVFGARSCWSCKGTGRQADGVNYCTVCQGAGFR